MEGALGKPVVKISTATPITKLDYFDNIAQIIKRHHIDNPINDVKRL